MNVLWKRVTSGAIGRSQSVDALRQLPRMLSELCPLGALAERAFTLADELRHPADDCFYLALADARDARLVTADRRLARRLEGTPWQERATTLWS